MTAEPNWPILLPSSELGVAFVMEGIKEWRTGDAGATVSKRFFAVALILFFMSFLAGTGHSFGINIPQPPSLIPFAAVSLVISAFLAYFDECRWKVRLRRKVEELSTRLREFQIECERRLRMSTTTELLAQTKHWAEGEYQQRFGVEINRLKPIWRLSPTRNVHYGEWLLGGLAPNAPTERLAAAAASTLATFSKELPSQWKLTRKRTFFISVMLYLTVAAAIWIGLVMIR